MAVQTCINALAASRLGIHTFADRLLKLRAHERRERALAVPVLYALHVHEAALEVALALPVALDARVRLYGTRADGGQQSAAILQIALQLPRGQQQRSDSAHSQS